MEDDYLRPYVDNYTLYTWNRILYDQNGIFWEEYYNSDVQSRQPQEEPVQVSEQENLEGDPNPQNMKRILKKMNDRIDFLERRVTALEGSQNNQNHEDDDDLDDMDLGWTSQRDNTTYEWTGANRTCQNENEIDDTEVADDAAETREDEAGETREDEAAETREDEAESSEEEEEKAESSEVETGKDDAETNEHASGDGIEEANRQQEKGVDEVAGDGKEEALRQQEQVNEKGEEEKGEEEKEEEEKEAEEKEEEAKVGETRKRKKKPSVHLKTPYTQGQKKKKKKT